MIFPRISLRKHRRWANIVIFFIVAGLIGYALFSQYIMGLEACPLCIFQRVFFISVGLIGLVAALHAPLSWGAKIYGFLGITSALVGAAIAGRHVYIQNMPATEVPACGPGLDYILDVFPLFEAIKMVFTGSGECAEVVWQFLGLSMPSWALIWFVLLGVLMWVANCSELSRYYRGQNTQ